MVPANAHCGAAHPDLAMRQNIVATVKFLLSMGIGAQYLLDGSQMNLCYTGLADVITTS